MIATSDAATFSHGMSSAMLLSAAVLVGCIAVIFVASRRAAAVVNAQ
jgi:hypothetical protein